LTRFWAAYTYEEDSMGKKGGAVDGGDEGEMEDITMPAIA